MLETLEKNIDGHDYQVTQFSAMRGLKYAVKLAKIIGPSAGKAINGGGLTDIMNSQLSISDMVEALVSKLDEDETPKFILELFGTTHRDRQQLSEKGFNEAFSANYGELFKALMFVLEVNYGSFFGALQMGDIGSPLSEKTKAKAEVREG